MEPLKELSKRETEGSAMEFKQSWMVLLCAIGLCVAGAGCMPEKVYRNDVNRPLLPNVPHHVQNPPLRRQVSNALIGRTLSARVHGDDTNFHSGDQVRLLVDK